MANTIPSVGKDRNWVQVLKRVMESAWGGVSVSHIDIPPVALNNEYIRAVDVAGTSTINLIKANASDQTEYAGAVHVYPSVVDLRASTSSLLSVDAAGNVAVASSANNVSIGGFVNNYKRVTFSSQSGVTSAQNRVFWISDGDYTVVSVSEIHSTAETTAATLTGYVEKVTGTLPAGFGVSVQATPFNFKGTANTLQTSNASTTASAIRIVAGDRLSYFRSTTPTQLVGITITVVLAPGNRNTQITSYTTAAMSVDQVMFVANRPYTVTRIDFACANPSTGAATLQLHKDTGTDAPGAGTATLLATAFDLQTAANTVVNGTPSATAADLVLAPGDRISLNFTGTVTGLTGCIVTITMSGGVSRVEETYRASAQSLHSDSVFFLADQAYEGIAASAVWSTAAAGGNNAQITIARGTDAPGAGTDLIALDTNAGFQIDGTANTVEVGTWKDSRFNFLMPGDRLCVDFTATTTLVGFCCTVSLRPA